MTTKIDYKKALKTLYNPPTRPFTEVNVPPLNFLMVDGSGNPNTAESYTQAVEALYGLSYALKFTVRREKDIDYGVMPLEGLWWADNMDDFITRNKDNWLWTMMIMQPEPVTADLVERVRDEVRRKKELTALDLVRFETYTEGVALQVMHIGSYDDEAPTLAAMHAQIAASGNVRSGKHHEIYLGDPRRTAPEKLKTVLRQPFRAK